MIEGIAEKDIQAIADEVTRRLSALLGEVKSKDKKRLVSVEEAAIRLGANPDLDQVSAPHRDMIVRWCREGEVLNPDEYIKVGRSYSVDVEAFIERKLKEKEAYQTTRRA